MDCDERRDPKRTILGQPQEKWLGAELAATKARWNLLAQQTLMMPYRAFSPDVLTRTPNLYNLDTWGGYPAARDRIVRQWRDARTSNPLILSGDIHAFVAGDHTDPDDARRIVASEFVGGSMTSDNHDPMLKEACGHNPGFRFADNVAHGYGRIELTQEACEITFRSVTDVREANSGVRDLARFAIENGKPGLQVA